MKKRPLTDKEIASIREYVEMRGKGHMEYQERDFLQAYEEADDAQRELFSKEMASYKKAVLSGRVREGESILK